MALGELDVDGEDVTAWIGPGMLARLGNDREHAFQSGKTSTAAGTIEIYTQLQNEAMLLKFFLEQALGGSPPGQKTQRIVSRDFEGWNKLHYSWSLAAKNPSVNWIILGLSFADFRFHIFPVGSAFPIPFCVSPISCWCFREDVLQSILLDREEVATRQWAATNWTAVEHRIDCLEEPLDIFSEPQECFSSEASCADGVL